jgi:hypothetical protein
MFLASRAGPLSPVGPSGGPPRPEQRYDSASPAGSARVRIAFLPAGPASAIVDWPGWTERAGAAAAEHGSEKAA